MLPTSAGLVVGPTMVAESVLLSRHDAVVVLSLRIARRTSPLLIPVGLGIALAAGISEARLGAEFATVSGWLDSLRSPLWVLGIALLLHVAVAPDALLAAIVATGSGGYAVLSDPGRRGPWTPLPDGFRVADGLRGLRLTYAVRAVAVELTGPLEMMPGTGQAHLSQPMEDFESESLGESASG